MTQTTAITKLAIGATSTDVLRHIALLNPNIQSFEFSRYKALENVAEMKTEPDLKTKMTRHYPPQAVTKMHAYNIRHSNEPNFGITLEEGEILNLHSRVVTSTGIQHIPMMDLDCIISDENLVKAGEYAKILGREGVILQSGRSYHYYGFHLQSVEEWQDFIASSMLAKVCDIRYMAHKLKDGFITLRITAGGLRNIVPRVVWVA